MVLCSTTKRIFYFTCKNGCRVALFNGCKVTYMAALEIVITCDCCWSCSVLFAFAQRWSSCYKSMQSRLTSPCMHASRWQVKLLWLGYNRFTVWGPNSHKSNEQSFIFSLLDPLNCPVFYLHTPSTPTYMSFFAMQHVKHETTNTKSSFQS